MNYGSPAGCSRDGSQGLMVNNHPTPRAEPNRQGWSLKSINPVATYDFVSSLAR